MPRIKRHNDSGSPPELAQDIIEGFRTLMPLYKYFDGLCAAEMV